MSYFAPFIDQSGFHYPTYNDIIEQLVDDAQTIFGSGIYLGSDSMDYEYLSKVAEKIFDSYQALETVCHSYSPVTAIGTGLDYIVAINGIARKQGTRSTAILRLTGTAGTVVTNGVASDANGYMWDLPETVTIGIDGTVDVNAACREVGVIQAAANTITHIMTPTLGWTGVTNAADATIGAVTEKDSSLRARREDSVAQPSQSILLGLKGALKSITDVQRVEVYENDTHSTDANGIPANSVCAVVEGGDSSEIAQTILFRKGCGCGTFGSTSETATDADGQSYVVKYSRPAYVDIDVAITISRRNGYKASMPDEIKAAIVAYLDAFTIGTDLTPSIIWMVAQQVNIDPRTPSFAIESLTAARHGGTLGVQDIAIAYDEVAKGRVSLIAITVQ